MTSHSDHLEKRSFEYKLAWASALRGLRWGILITKRILTAVRTKVLSGELDSERSKWFRYTRQGIVPPQLRAGNYIGRRTWRICWFKSRTKV